MRKNYRFLLIVAITMMIIVSACQSSPAPEVQSTESVQEEVTVTEEPYPAPPVRPQTVYNPYPGPSEGVKEWTQWEQAVVVIKSGDVVEVYQVDTLHVTLVLADGSVVLAKEPEIDEVFRIIDECGDPCSDIVDRSE